MKIVQNKLHGLSRFKVVFRDTKKFYYNESYNKQHRKDRSIISQLMLLNFILLVLF